VSHTWELGLRGKMEGHNNERFEWTAGLFRALNTNDIYTVAAPITGRGYFDNIGDTLRQGVEIGGRYVDERWMIYANYALVHATFQSSFILPSPNNPAAFECGEDDGEELTCVQVNDGDRIPGIPLSRFKTGFDYLITPQWRFGADLIAASSQIFYGDEGNDTAPLFPNGRFDGVPMEVRAMVSYFAIASTAGHDTTAATTATGMWVLAEQPEMLARLKADPGLIPGFVEESIRWTSPVQQFVRSATQDYDLRGRKIKKGDLIYLSYISANRDEEVFEDPFVFKPDRTPNRHVGFGYGGHICLGQHLARLEMRLFWEELIPRLKSVEMAGEGRMSESEFVCGPKSVPIRFEMEG
jgi:hypothetical protein